MSLYDYRRKRRFDRTPEPSGGPRRRARGMPRFRGAAARASHRHYDFRLQVGGTPPSCFRPMPEGPGLDPSVAAGSQVEDHPLDYADFEDIPTDQYGAGHVAIFDHGTWATDGDAEEQLASGHLRFQLFGGKLRGGWHLVRSGARGRQPEWLLFKARDAYAAPLEADDLLDAAPPGQGPAAGATTPRAGAGPAPVGSRGQTARCPPHPRRTCIPRALALATLVEAVPDGAAGCTKPNGMAIG